MKRISQKQRIAILRVLRDAGEPVSSSSITRELQGEGFDMSDRTVRLYLQDMESENLVESASRGRNGGRTITPKGIAEIKDARVVDRIGLTAAKMDALAYQMNFNPVTKRGRVVINITLTDEASLARAVHVMRPVFDAKLGMGELVTLAYGGDHLGGFQVPEGKVAIGTLCSVTLNGVLLSSRIPSASRFAGVLEVENRLPVRFTDLIYYNGTSLDPLEVFIKGRLIHARETARLGKGRIGASFREVPTKALGEVERIVAQLRRIGMDGVLLIGKPNQPLLDFAVDEGRTGIIMAGGMNPAAALEEAEVPNLNFALSALIDFDRLFHYSELTQRVPNRMY